MTTRRTATRRSTKLHDRKRAPRPANALAALCACAALLALGCPGQGGPPPAVPKATSGKKAEPIVVRPSKSGLGFRLSDAAPEEEARPALAPSTMLSAADTQKLLSRLPPLASDPDDVKSFAFRERSMPAPRPGRTVQQAFPPPQGGPPPVASTAGPLTITRHAPEGEIALAPRLDIAFSKPMVALTSHDDLAKTPPPVTLTPEPPGKWRWLGTQSVVFDPTLGRFPMSTDYKVEIKAGTRSVDGSALARTETFTFSTPTLTLASSWPSGSSVELEPIMFAGFDQGIDPVAISRTMKVRAGSNDVAITLVPADEIEGNARLRAMAKERESKPGDPPRWLAFKPQRPLPKATSITVTFPEGTQSVEGPKKTASAQSFGFSTYGPMTLTSSYCNYRNAPCAPLAPFHLGFSNAIDANAFDKKWVHVTPELEAMKVEVSGAGITVRGRTKGRTKYVVTVDPALKDRFGQTMAREATANFQVGSAMPMLFSEDSPQIVLDPADPTRQGSTHLPVYSVNRESLKVRLYAVRPEDWGRYLKWRRDWDYDGKDTTPPGKLVFNQSIATKKAPDELVETFVPLASALNGGFGQVVAVVEPPGGHKGNRWGGEWVRQWIQVTSIGLDSFSDQEKAFVWTTSLTTGAPLAGANVTLLPSTTAFTTGADGIAKITLPEGEGRMLVARKGNDLVMLNELHDDDISLRRYSSYEPTRWFTFDDRRMYKPGEEVHVKGWVRAMKGAPTSDVAKAEGRKVHFKANDTRGAKIVEGDADLDPSGGFDFAFKLPKDANLGQGVVELSLDGSRNGSHTYMVQEFRRPEFEVNIGVSEGPHQVGKHAVATVAAKYYAGGGLPAAETQWIARSQTASFTPPNLSGYSFGKPPEAWWTRSRSGRTNKPESETWKARTSAAGEHRLRVDFDAIEPPYPLNVDLEATVTDVNRQQWTARSTILVHPGDLTVGLRAQRAFVRAGESLPVEAVVSDLDGNLVAGSKVAVRGARLDEEWTPDGYKEREVETQTCDVTSGKEPVKCLLPTKNGGRFAVTAIVTDTYGRKSQTRIELWVAGDTSPRDRELTTDKVQVLADKPAYAPGDTAELLLLAPFAPAEGVLTLQREGIVHFERFKLEKTSQVVRVKVDRYFPSVLARVGLVGLAPRENLSGEPDPKLPPRPAFAFGETQLGVPAKERTLAITTKAQQEKVDPGAEVQIDVDVKDNGGRAVPGAHVALVVVDEAILALAGGKLPDPISVFYQPRNPGGRELRTRDRVWLPKPKEVQLTARGGDDDESSDKRKEDSAPSRSRGPGAAPKPMMKAAMEAAPMADMAAPPPAASASAAGRVVSLGEIAVTGEQPKLDVRKDFAALAAWLPRLVSDGAGHINAKVKLPQSLTRFRIMAVGASAFDSFGAGESTVTVRLPMMVRPSATRFLNFGDRMDMPIVVQNQTDAPMEVAVAARATNARMLDTGGRRVVVPANDRVEVRVPVAADKPGTARFQFAAASGRYGDAANIELPVWTPATTEAFATYGTIDEGAVAQAVRMPNNVVKEFGALEITTSSTGLQGLTDAVLYLQRYPFDCNEQIASRVLSIAALRDVLGAFNAKELPKPEVLAAGVKADLEKLRTRQHYSGGFSFWGPNYEPYPWVSVHVAHALTRAKSKGYDLPGDMAPRAQNYLRSIEGHIPHWYSPDAKRAIIAYALYVRQRFNDADVTRARSLIREAGGVDKTPIEILGWLLPILGPDASSQADVTAIRRHLANRVTETAGAAHFATNYGDGGYVLLHSDRRADGVLLEALIGDQKDSDLIPKLVTGLLGHRKAGRWSSTQENAFVLLALDRYFQTYEKQTPNFVGRAWLGEKLALEQTFQGRNTDRNNVAVPLSVLAELVTPLPNKEASLVLAKDGVGRMYYRVGMSYAPSDLRPPPTEQGFSVSRSYEAVDDPGDVRREADGTYRIKAGSKVRVRVNMVAQSRRHHVALVDPLPAGLEPLNPALATTGTVPEDPRAADKKGGVPWWWSRTWYEHQNMRDERVEAFTSLLYDGVYDYTYVAVATTPGVFVAPPPKAEEMYNPETFGRGAGDRVIVE